MAQTESVVREFSRLGNAKDDYPVAANTTIYEGQIVMINAAGYAVPAADTAGCHVVGLCRAQVTCGATAGSVYVKVDKHVEVRLKALAAFVVTQGNVGDVVYVTDDETFGRAADETNDIRMGWISRFISGTEAWVTINPDAQIQAAQA